MRPIHRAHDRSLAGRTPEQVRADRIEEARLAAAECLRHGVTSFQDAGSTIAEADVLRELAEAGQLPVRLWIMLDDGNDVLARRLAEKPSDRRGQRALHCPRHQAIDRWRNRHAWGLAAVAL